MRFVRIDTENAQNAPIVNGMAWQNMLMEKNSKP